MNPQAKKTNSTNRLESFRIRLIPVFFEEDAQLNPGLCWERKQKSQDLDLVNVF